MQSMLFCIIVHLSFHAKNPKDTILCLWDPKTFYVHKIAAPDDAATNTVLLSAIFRGNRLLYEVIFNATIHLCHC